jgi:hypothetical protein
MSTFVSGSFAPHGWRVLPADEVEALEREPDEC